MINILEFEKQMSIFIETFKCSTQKTRLRKGFTERELIIPILANTNQMTIFIETIEWATLKMSY